MKDLGAKPGVKNKKCVIRKDRCHTHRSSLKKVSCMKNEMTRNEEGLLECKKVEGFKFICVHNEEASKAAKSSPRGSMRGLVNTTNLKCKSRLFLCDE